MANFPPFVGGGFKWVSVRCSERARSRGILDQPVEMKGSDAGVRVGSRLERDRVDYRA